jgi:hypothetical protein
MGYQIAPVQVGKRSAEDGRVICNHLNESPELRHTLRIANHPGHGRTLARSHAHSHGQQHQRDKRDLHLGSLHSKAVLRVDGSFKIVSTRKNRGASLQNAKVLVIANRNPHNHVAGLASHLPNPQ